MTIDNLRTPLNAAPLMAPKCEIDERVDYSVRGCSNPECRAETRAYVTWQGKDWCEKCIGVVKMVAFGDAVKPCQCEEGGNEVV